MHSFEEIDSEGLEALKAQKFIEYDGMLFRKNTFNISKVQQEITRSVPASTIQLQMNHLSLISYGGDVHHQRKRAQEIVSVWIERLWQEFPSLYPYISSEISVEEVILSVRAVRRE